MATLNNSLSSHKRSLYIMRTDQVPQVGECILGSRHEYESVDVNEVNVWRSEKVLEVRLIIDEECLSVYAAITPTSVISVFVTEISGSICRKAAEKVFAAK